MEYEQKWGVLSPGQEVRNELTFSVLCFPDCWRLMSNFNELGINFYSGKPLVMFSLFVTVASVSLTIICVCKAKCRSGIEQHVFRGRSTIWFSQSILLLAKLYNFGLHLKNQDIWEILCWHSVKESACYRREWSSIPDPRRSTGARTTKPVCHDYPEPVLQSPLAASHTGSWPTTTEVYEPRARARQQETIAMRGCLSSNKDQHNQKHNKYFKRNKHGIVCQCTKKICSVSGYSAIRCSVKMKSSVSMDRKPPLNLCPLGVSLIDISIWYT